MVVVYPFPESRYIPSKNGGFVFHVFDSYEKQFFEIFPIGCYGPCASRAFSRMRSPSIDCYYFVLQNRTVRYNLSKAWQYKG